MTCFSCGEVIPDGEPHYGIFLWAHKDRPILSWHIRCSKADLNFYHIFNTKYREHFEHKQSHAGYEKALRERIV